MTQRDMNEKLMSEEKYWGLLPFSGNLLG